MDLNRIKKFAQGSRRKLITQIESRLEYVLGYDDAYLRAHAKEKTIIQQLHERKGRKHLLEEVAYTWFNRLAALRYMDAKGFFPVRVVTPAAGETQPQILAEAKAGRFPDQIQAARSQINDYLDARVQTPEPEREAYKAALLAWCNAMGEVLPFLFTTVEDWVALLLPTDLLSKDSIVSDFQTGMKDEDCTDVEIVGWLYQFYISEKKDQVIGKVVASEDIPAATQLFTPNWIVKYMVQNSLGARWLATYPDSPLKGQMEYYIEPAEQTDEVKAQLAAITPSTLDPEELTLIDPACGSGHILVEAYEIFKAIYLERGYPQQDVAQLILERNLFGLDICGRAAQLACFALMMKGRADDRRFFERGLKLNVMALANSEGFDAERLAQGVKLGDYGLQPSDVVELRRLFEHATTFGSLIQVPEELAAKLPALKRLCEATSHDLFLSDAIRRFGPLVQQAEMLAAQYDAVVANPPYMGSRFQNSALRVFVQDQYTEAQADLFACFIKRSSTLTRDSGRFGLVTRHGWMFLSSYEAFRRSLLCDNCLISMVHLGSRAFSEISGEVVQTTSFTMSRLKLPSWIPTILRLVEGNESEKKEDLLKRRFSYQSVSAKDWNALPGGVIAYWAPQPVFTAYKTNNPLGVWTPVKEGMNTGDNAQFHRMWFEVEIQNISFGSEHLDSGVTHSFRWFPTNKGGPYRKWYGNNYVVVDWENDGDRIRHHPKSTVRNSKYYFLPGITWSCITSSLSARIFESGFVFNSAGRCLFPPNNRHAVLGLLNSSTGELFLKMTSTNQFSVGDVAAIPFEPAKHLGLNDKVRSLVDQLVESHRKDWNEYECSWDFISFPILLASSESTTILESNYTAWITQNRDTIAEMKRLEEENNRLFIDAYGLQDELTPDIPIEQITLTVNPAYRYGGKLSEEEQWTRFRQDTMKELVSYAVGCIMGRYSLDKPGLILANAGDGIQEYLNQVPEPSFMPDEDAILPVTAEDDFEDDLPSRVRAFIRVAFSNEHYDENIRFLEEGLGYDIKTYVLRHFYKDHLQYYKTLPIYWMVSSPSGDFRCLIYLHRYTQDTVGTILGSYLRPYRYKLEARRERNRRMIDSPTGSSADRSKAQNTVDEITRTLQELEQWEREMVYPLAQERIALDLDDGVKVNYGKLGAILEKVKGLNA